MAESPRKPVSGTSASKAIRRAIRKTDPTHETPIVGNPVIVEPVGEKVPRADDKKRDPSR